VVPATETIDDTLVVFADTVIVEGVVLGDIIAFGGQVRLAGRTHGSLLFLARRLDVDGQVDGDGYAVLDSIGVRGRVGRNVHLASARADLAAGSVVARDLVALVATPIAAAVLALTVLGLPLAFAAACGP
jgi:hypothetical protein